MSVGAQKVRIIGGSWRRTVLPVAQSPGLRPTPDRVRETLFNWLDHDLSGLVCLDLFAGTGALGFEAASRGAASVWFAETQPKVQSAIQASIERLQATDRLRLHRGDARSLIGVLGRQGIKADLVFLDPPFQQGLVATTLPVLAPVLAPQAWIYVESEAPLTAELVLQHCGPQASLIRQATAGQVHYHLVRIQSHPAGAQETT